MKDSDEVVHWTTGRMVYDLGTSTVQDLGFTLFTLSLLELFTQNCSARTLCVGRTRPGQVPGRVLLSSWHCIRSIVGYPLPPKNNEPCGRLRALGMHYRGGEHVESICTCKLTQSSRSFSVALFGDQGINGDNNWSVVLKVAARMNPQVQIGEGTS